MGMQHTHLSAHESEADGLLKNGRIATMDSLRAFVFAGVAVTHYGLRETTDVYGLVVMALAAMMAVAVWCRRARPAAAV